MKRIIFILLLFVSVSELFPQGDLIRRNDFILGINGGILYGGPIPTKSNPDFSGSPIFGPFIGLYTDYIATPAIHIQTALNLSLKGINIGGHYVRDTMVEVNMGGQIGTVPTFYTADIIGSMNLLYLDLPVFFTYEISGRSYIFAGGQASLLIGGEYTTDAHVVVGEGGFYDDVNKHFDMYNDVTRLDFSACLGGAYKVFKDLTLKIYGTRSFVPFNKPGTGDPSTTGNLYNTYVITSLVYDF